MALDKVRSFRKCMSVAKQNSSPSVPPCLGGEKSGFERSRFLSTSDCFRGLRSGTAHQKWQRTHKKRSGRDQERIEQVPSGCVSKSRPTDGMSPQILDD